MAQSFDNIDNHAVGQLMDLTNPTLSPAQSPRSQALDDLLNQPPTLDELAAPADEWSLTGGLEWIEKKVYADFGEYAKSDSEMIDYSSVGQVVPEPAVDLGQTFENTSVLEPVALDNFKFIADGGLSSLTSPNVFNNTASIDFSCFGNFDVAFFEEAEQPFPAPILAPGPSQEIDDILETDLSTPVAPQPSTPEASLYPAPILSPTVAPGLPFAIPAPARSTVIRPYNLLLQYVPAFDFDMSSVITSLEPVNFTMAEIIGILPKWHRDWMVCNRFVNNGITHEAHRAIVREFRIHEPADETPTTNTIGASYRNTMRPLGWKDQRSAAIAANIAPPKLWTLRNHVLPGPDAWDDQDISVNHLIPNRVLMNNGNPAPRSVPFSHLERGLSRLPSGFDEGDLTRAIRFAKTHDVVRVGNAVAEEFLFPDDLELILSYTGHTIITRAHTDKEVIRRYQPAPRAHRRNVAGQFASGQ
jgi:hypothetical protein